jgi:hypothetical protein
MDTFWRWFDRAARLDFFGNVVGHFFDWRGWIAGLVGGGGGGVTFLWAAIDGRSPLDVWVIAVVVAAALAATSYYSIGAFQKIVVSRQGSLSFVASNAIEPNRGTATAQRAAPDIDAGAAYNEFMRNGDWGRDRLRPETDPANLRSDWKEVKLDTEIHKALVNAELASWGEEVLQNGATVPERPIPANEWTRIELIFGRVSVPRTIARTRVPLPYTGKLAWGGVRLCRAQFFTLFPLIDTISLLDAATRAHEQLKNRPISISVESFARTADDILLGYCRLLAFPRGNKSAKIALMGIKPPSRSLEKIVISHNWDFEIDGGQIILKEMQGHFRYEQITTSAADLATAIDELAQMAV